MTDSLCWPRIPGPGLKGSAYRACEQAHEEQHQEHEEQHLADHREAGRNAAEAEDRGEQCEHQKRESPLQHGIFSCLRVLWGKPAFIGGCFRLAYNANDVPSCIRESAGDVTADRVATCDI